MEFSRQEYWSELHSLHQGVFLTLRLIPGLLHCRQILHHLSTREASLKEYLLLKTMTGNLESHPSFAFTQVSWALLPGAVQSLEDRVQNVLLGVQHNDECMTGFHVYELIIN